MLRFSSSPLEPPNFEAHVGEARTAITAIIGRRRLPKSADFEDRWGSFKASLLAVQHNKCGYCENNLATHPADVEHYRPKAELQALPPNKRDWGEEGEGVFSVVGRKPARVSDEGYWWSAYAWDNYLAACNRCNSGWKRNIFPVDENPRTGPSQAKAEVELLLNPFRGEDPADHLEFDKLGQVKPLNGSKHGEATIGTCGLDRPSLVQARNEKVTRAYLLVDQYLAAKTTEERTRVLRDFIEMGSEKYAFAGMVRAIFKQQLNLPWKEWEQTLTRGQA